MTAIKVSVVVLGIVAVLEATVGCSPSTESLRSAAKHASEAGDAAGAVQAWSRVLENSPSDPEALLERGRARLVTGDLEGASNDFAAGLELDQQNISLRLGLAQAKRRLNQDQEALGHYSDVLKIDPANSEALEQRANLYARAGSCREALADRRRLSASTSVQAEAAEIQRCREAVASQDELTEGLVGIRLTMAAAAQFNASMTEINGQRTGCAESFGRPGLRPS